MNDTLARIKAIGFTQAGHWKLCENRIVYELSELMNARNVLYSFVVDGEVMYVGKTTISLHDRMQRYKTPAKTSAKGGSTNIKNNRNIQEILSQNKTIEIFVLSDNGLLHYGGFHINLAAGLEDSLVRELRPPWNGGKKETSGQSLEPTDEESFSPME